MLFLFSAAQSVTFRAPFVAKSSTLCSRRWGVCGHWLPVFCEHAMLGITYELFGKTRSAMGVSIDSLDEMIFGWDPLPGIVSIWASRSGKALLWQRSGERVRCLENSFRPWLFATTLDDVYHLASSLQPDTASSSARALVTYQELDGEEGSYRYLLSARDGRVLKQTLLTGASRRLGCQIASLGELPETYYRVGPVEQYLMFTGRVSFRGMVYEDLHRLAFDLETTSLDPARGRIFLVVIRDNRGHESILKLPHLSRKRPSLLISAPSSATVTPTRSKTTTF